MAVGTANMQFHRDLVALAGSPRTEQVTERLLAEMRLAFHAVASPQRLHEAYVGRNRALVELLAAGEFEQAADAARGVPRATRWPSCSTRCGARHDDGPDRWSARRPRAHAGRPGAVTGMA